MGPECNQIMHSTSFTCDDLKLKSQRRTRSREIEIKKKNERAPLYISTGWKCNAHIETSTHLFKTSAHCTILTHDDNLYPYHDKINDAIVRFSDVFQSHSWCFAFASIPEMMCAYFEIEAQQRRRRRQISSLALIIPKMRIYKQHNQINSNKYKQ